jgi:two-component system response regulator DesR
VGTVLIADGDAAVRRALGLLIAQDPRLHVRAEAAEAEMLLAQLGLHCVDLLLLDWHLPGLRIAALLPALRLLCPQMKLIALSSRLEVAQAAADIGANGFVDKGTAPDRLLPTVHRVLED